MSILGGSWLSSLRAHAALPGVPPFAFAALSGGMRLARRDGRRIAALDGARGRVSPASGTTPARPSSVRVPESAELRGLRAELRGLEVELRAFGADAGTGASRTGVGDRAGTMDGATP